MWAKVPWTCLHSIIQHYLGSLQDPPLHKNCFILSLHENKFFGFEWEWPCRRQLPTETSPKAVLEGLRLGCRPVTAEGRVLVWTSTERGEGRSITGSTLVLAQGPRALWRRSTPVCSNPKRGLRQAREKATDILPAPGSILRGNLEPTPCRRRGPPVVA